MASVERHDGATVAEQYVKQLCERSFLSLWSYACLFRDQGLGDTGGEGKELCDLLIVFDKHIIIISDKDCAFKDTGNLDLDWSRWFKRAVEKSAQQVWGAERWIKNFPNRLYLDRACTQRFPVPMPDPMSGLFHRIVVAHGVSARCREELGGSGSLMINPEIVGAQHLATTADGGMPFAIGKIDPSRGFVHVLDDTSLDIVLSTLDTISDFVEYLTKKERFLTSGRHIFVAGEEELLAYYLRYTDERDEHDFVVPDGTARLDKYDGVWIDEGFWEEFRKHPQRKAQIAENKISYAWDRLIETFNGHALAGTQYFTSQPGDQVRTFLYFGLSGRRPEQTL